MNSHFFKTRHFSPFCNICVILKNVYACLTLGNLFPQFGSASVLRVFFCLFGIFKEDFVLTKYLRLTTQGNKSSHWAECLCQPWQGKYPAPSRLCFSRWATTSSRTAAHAVFWCSRLPLRYHEPGLQSGWQCQGNQMETSPYELTSQPADVLTGNRDPKNPEVENISQVLMSIRQILCRLITCYNLLAIQIKPQLNPPS